MSTNVSPAVNLMNEAYRELCTRIKTGKLRNSSRNGSLLVGRTKEKHPELFVDWQTKGLPAASQLADAFLSVLTKEPEFAILLDWEKVPAALAPKKQDEPAKFGDQRDVSTFEQRVRESERKDVEDKAQAAARKQALELIERFSPLNHRSGRPTYEIPVVDDRGRFFRDATTGMIKRQSVDKLRAEWRDRIAKAKDAIKVLEGIKAQQTLIYNALEKEAERV